MKIMKTRYNLSLDPGNTKSRRRKSKQIDFLRRDLSFQALPEHPMLQAFPQTCQSILRVFSSSSISTALFFFRLLMSL